MLQFLVLVGLLAGSQLSAQDASTNKDQHLGTWRLALTKYAPAKEFTKYGTSSKRVKFITKTHFAWMEIAETSKEVLSSAGGSYTLAGGAYIETLEYAGSGMEPYLGKAQKFTIRIEGDKLHQSGELSDGLKIEEVWERVK